MKMALDTASLVPSGLSPNQKARIVLKTDELKTILNLRYLTKEYHLYTELEKCKLGGKHLTNLIMKKWKYRVRIIERQNLNLLRFLDKDKRTWSGFDLTDAVPYPKILKYFLEESPRGVGNTWQDRSPYYEKKELVRKYPQSALMISKDKRFYHSSDNNYFMEAACILGNADIAQNLLKWEGKNGEKVNPSKCFGAACMGGNAKIVKMLLEWSKKNNKSIDMEYLSYDYFHGSAVLEEIAIDGYVEVLKLLSMELNERNCPVFGYYCIDHCIENGHVDTIKFLIEWYHSYPPQIKHNFTCDLSNFENLKYTARKFNSLEILNLLENTEFISSLQNHK
jgi:hypothetical protein